MPLFFGHFSVFVECLVIFSISCDTLFSAVNNTSLPAKNHSLLARRSSRRRIPDSLKIDECVLSTYRKGKTEMNSFNEKMRATAKLNCECRRIMEESTQSMVLECLMGWIRITIRNPTKHDHSHSLPSKIYIDFRDFSDSLCHTMDLCLFCRRFAYNMRLI